MSLGIDRLPLGAIRPTDYLVVGQGGGLQTHRCTVALFLAANRVYPGGLAAQTPKTRHISELPLATEVFQDDLIIVNQGSPAISRVALVSMVLAASATTTAQNTELFDSNRNMYISGMPRAASVSLTDQTVLNQGDPPLARTTRVPIAGLQAFGPIVALYSFDNNLYDYANNGNPHDATMVNGSFVVDNPFGSGTIKSLKGSSAGIAARAPASGFYSSVLIGAANKPYTIEFWFKGSYFSGSSFTQLFEGNNWGAQISSPLTINLGVNDINSDIAGPADGNWHFVSMTRAANGTTDHFAVDGVLRFTYTTGGAVQTMERMLAVNGQPAAAGINTLVSNLRITTGVDRYPTFPYAVPTAPFPLPVTRP